MEKFKILCISSKFAKYYIVNINCILYDTTILHSHDKLLVVILTAIIYTHTQILLQKLNRKETYEIFICQFISLHSSTIFIFIRAMYHFYVSSRISRLLCVRTIFIHYWSVIIWYKNFILLLLLKLIPSYDFYVFP